MFLMFEVRAWMGIRRQTQSKEFPNDLIGLNSRDTNSNISHKRLCRFNKQMHTIDLSNTRICRF